MSEAAATAPTQVSSVEIDRQGRAGFATLIVLSHAFKHMCTAALTAALIPEIKLTLDLTATQVGTLGSVQQFSGWFSTMMSGYLGDRFVHRTGRMLAISLAITGIALFVIGLA